MAETETLLTMAFPKKKVESILFGLEDMLNQRLIKLIGFDFPFEQRQHFRREINGWLNKIRRLRFKPDRRTGTARFYYDWLFDYPLGDDPEAESVAAIMQLIGEDYPTAHPIATSQDVAARLQAFHVELSKRLHAGAAVLDLVPE
jgi:hypothetical protein